MIRTLCSSQRLSILLRVVLAVVAVGFVVTQVDLDSIMDAASGANTTWIMVALALLPVNLLLEALAWQPLLQQVVPGIGLLETLLSVLGGYPLGTFTPARVGDFAGRALYLSRGNRFEIGLSAAVARLPDLLAVLLVGTASLMIGRITGSAGFAGSGLLAGASVVATLFVVSLMAAPSVIRRGCRGLPILRRLEQRLAFLDHLPRSLMLDVSLRSLARFGVYFAQFVVLALAFSPESELSLVLMAVAWTFLAKSVIPPVTFMDLGIREGAAAYFFGFLGLGAATGFNAGLMLFTINLALPALLGVPLMTRYRVRADHVRSKLPNRRAWSDA